MAEQRVLVPVAPEGVDGATPLVKWAGGKRWLAPLCAPAIRAYLEASGGRYIEPFLGGAAVALAVARGGALLGDIEVPLVELYRAVAGAPRAVAAHLAQLVAAGVDRDSYHAVRARTPRASLARAARLLYLNRLAYNGLYRVNQAGRFNVPFGRYPRPSFPGLEQLERVSRALAGARLHAGDFEVLVAAAGRGDVVLADPPYLGTSGIYSRQAFTISDHERLAAALRAAARRGAAVISTNADRPELRDWYAWADIVPTAESRSIACKGASRARTRCLLITTHPSLVWPRAEDAKSRPRPRRARPVAP